MPISSHVSAIEETRNASRQSFAIGFLALAAMFLFLVGAGPARGPSDNVDNIGVLGCEANVRQIGAPFLNGLPVVDGQVELVGEQVKVLVQYPGSCGELDLTSSLPFVWRLTDPTGQNVPLMDGTTLRPNFRPTVAGTYVAKLTFCPNNCQNLDAGILPQSASTSFFVLTLAQISPETRPKLPTRIATKPRNNLDNKCESSVFDDAGSPQLFTVENFKGSQNYGSVEGEVLRANISWKDNELNHTSHDIGIKVRPDPWFNHMMVAGHEDMEIEWESDYLPGPMRPSAGDRISAYGFYVYDCHHPPPATEIHPPVLTAVHRMRPVRIPDGWPATDPLGAGIWVPGVLTDIWVNARAGEMTSNCSTTGLHRFDAEEPIPLFRNKCIRAPHPLRRAYTFQIYLPRNPAKRAAAAGMNAPSPPLMTELRNVSGAPACPVTIENLTGPTDDFLRVTVDLTNFTGETCAARIAAAWALPSADNYGLEAWNFGIVSMNVYEDHDWGDGDWIFWASVNNRDKEWTRLLNENDVDDDDDVYDFDGRPFETGLSETSGRSLGPHLLLFNPIRFPGAPPQTDLTRSLEFHTSGYDAELKDNEVGGVFEVLTPDPFATSIGQVRRFSQMSTTGDYRLNYFYRRLGPEPAPRLAAAGQRLVSAFTPNGGARCTRVRASLCLLLPDFTNIAAWHPAQTATTPGGPVLEWLAHPAFEPKEEEPGNFTEMPFSDVRKWIVATQKTNPERVREILSELAEEFQAVKGTKLEKDHARYLSALKPFVPTRLWRAHFARFDAPANLVVHGVSMSPPGARGGEKVQFMATIENTGLRAATPFKVRLLIDGREHDVVSSRSLPPGDKVELGFPVWTATRGNHRIRVTADAAEAVAEANEGDNEYERQFPVGAALSGGPGIDAAVAPVEVTPPEVRQ